LPLLTPVDGSLTKHHWNLVLAGILDAIARLDLKDGETLLEICPGAGYAVEEALQHKGVQVVAVDLSPEMVRLASERNRAGIAEGRAEVTKHSACAPRTWRIL
jgi:cyclopropane fatty-acyl-phospholipid synthase-like methyltransferase